MPGTVMIDWKRNLLVVWLSQFFSIASFTFALPFAPFYLQDLGITDPKDLKIWVSIFAAATPLSLAVCAPIWGVIADRFGRRVMLLRANIGGIVVLALMGCATSATLLVAARVLQGCLTGTMTAAQTLVSAHTPRRHSGFALGALSSGVFSGAMAGSFCGGLFADRYGYRGAFFVAAALLVIPVILVLAGARERFERPARRTASRAAHMRSGIVKLQVAMPILLLLGAISLVRRFDFAFLPLLVQEIHGRLAGASRWTGTIMASAGLAAMASAALFGRLADRFQPTRLGVAACLGAGCCLVPVTIVQHMVPLLALRLGVAFAAAGLDPVFQSLLAKRVPRTEHGFLFGWMATMRALGMAFAPMGAGLAAYVGGTRAVFLSAALLFLALAAFIAWGVQSRPTDS
jgi:DHA1 family multidrug resistance protein-like MFS transporter